MLPYIVAIAIGEALALLFLFALCEAAARADALYDRLYGNGDVSGSPEAGE